jgi:1,4-alpha-glucan branching enzyme
MSNVITHSLLTDYDIHLFRAGKHYRLYEKMGAHPMELDGVAGVYFSVWAPSATSVSVIGEFNHWSADEHILNVRWDSSGIWEGFIPEIGPGTLYKFHITSSLGGMQFEKADPFARRSEHPPRTASVVWTDGYEWKDSTWMTSRKQKNALDKPFSVYEVHLGSWRRHVEEDRFLSYVELADALVDYVRSMNFTHVEFMPVMEYPYDPSWGYQITGYFAPSSRFGTPDEFKYLIDRFHEENIGVILDWVPSHFPEDAHGLGKFDGSCLYEHPDPKKGFHPDWKSLIFNYERSEVRSFLISNALFWLDQFHVDGLRVDAVASMLYLDYSREDDQWEPNEFGGRENLSAISFLKELNEQVYQAFPDVQTIAEESTSFPMVSSPTSIGGLGFGMKWMMGWMHDTLEYFKRDPIHRKFHQNDITFSMTYAFTENFMLPLSHDEVVYGKNSLLGRMPGDEWQRFANLRLLYGFMYTHPGTKLLFMGGEIGQYEEWNFQDSLDWHLLKYPSHNRLNHYVSRLNAFYKSQNALYEEAFSDRGFEWINYGDHGNSVISFVRTAKKSTDRLIVVCNFTPELQQDYRIGLPGAVSVREVFNSDSEDFGGSGVVNSKMMESEALPWNGRDYSVALTLPPLGMTVLALD